MSDALPFLVTGASGFLGRHLLEAHAASGDGRPVLALVRDPDAWSDLSWTAALGSVEPIGGSVSQPEGWAEALPPVSAILHLAALVRHTRRNPEPVFETNVEGTLHMVRLAAANACRLVVVSTSGTVGCFRDPDSVADETSPHCEREVAGWPYYRSKILMERKARELADGLGVELVFLRPPVLLGPGDHRFRSTSNVLRALRGKLPFLLRGGMHFADVRDAAAAILCAATRPAIRPVYHLDGTVCSIQQFFGLIAEISGVPAPRRVLPFLLAWLLASAAQRLGILLRGEPLHILPDPVVVEMAARYWGMRSLYAADDLGYRCRCPRETLRDTVAWLRANDETLGGTRVPP